jgi:hypothetical protein
MQNTQRSTSRDHWLGNAATNTVRRRTILGQFSKAMCITALFSVVCGGGAVWAAKRGGESNMDIVSEAASESRQLRSKAPPPDEALRQHWASFKSIPTIAQVMDVNTGWVRGRAMSIGLAVRPRDAIIRGA